MSNRPRYSDEAIALQVAQKLLPRITLWAEEYGTAEQLQKELADAIHRSAPIFEAEQIAQYLEKRHLWASNEKLVEILDMVDVEANAVHREAVAAWVSSNAIRPKKAVGDIVEVPPRAGEFRLRRLAGEIVGINEEQATYTVFVADRGHVRTGLGTHGHILPFEDFHDLAAPPEEFVLSSQ